MRHSLRASLSNIVTMLLRGGGELKILCYNTCKHRSVVAELLRNETRIHEHVGSIPGFTQPVKELSGLRIRRCRELWCRSQTRLGPALLWLWCRPAATALIGSLAWELPYATDVALKRQKEEREKELFLPFLCLFFIFLPFGAAPMAYGGS